MMLNQQLLQNQTINNINTDSATASILDNLSIDYIYHIVSDSINMRFRPYSTAMPNIPASLEQNFKIQMAANPSSTEEVLTKRDMVYRQIIEILCNNFHLIYTGSEDIYADAFYLYHFLVSDFTNTVVGFYVNYIMKEKKHLYAKLNLGDAKKNKDSSVAYSKKLYANNTIAMIHANILQIVAEISSYDISLNDVLECRYMGDEAVYAYHISNIVHDAAYFFDNIRVFTTGTFLPDPINCIKLALQSASAEMIKLNQLGGE